jgi:hypothetical protein
VVVVIVRTLETAGRAGVTVGGMNEHDALERRAGGNMHDRVTGCPVPLVSVAFIVLVPDLPLIAVMGPELDRE